MRSNNSDLKLVIIGDGPMQTEVESAVKERSNIQYLGFQPKAVIMDHLKRAKSLVFPSIWYEGFPLTILEALATGTPVIGSRIGGIARNCEQTNSTGYFLNLVMKDSLIHSLNELRDHDLKGFVCKCKKELPRTIYARTEL